jgi:ribose 5-phosphate isomerase A
MAEATQKASPEQLEKIGIAAAKLVRPGDRVGLGSGKAALHFVRQLGVRVREEGLRCIGVPTSLLTGEVAREAGVPLATLSQVDGFDIVVDGADEVDPDLNLLKGGGGNLAREKVIASIAKRFVIVVGEEKIVPALGTSFPVFIEVIEFAQPVVVRKIEGMGGRVTQRMNPDGTPFITDNQNPYLEAVFGDSSSAMADAVRLEHDLKLIPGVVDTGLFTKIADEVLVARFDGSIERKTRQ